MDRKRKSVVGQASRLCAVRACEERAREVVRGRWTKTTRYNLLVPLLKSSERVFACCIRPRGVQTPHTPFLPSLGFSSATGTNTRPSPPPSSAASQTKTMSLETRRDELTTAADACEADNERLRVEVLKAGPFPEGRSICLTDSAMLHSYTQRSRNWTNSRARRRTTHCGCVAFVHFRDLC